MNKKATILFRPVGEKELAKIREAKFKAFPSRLPEQPIFYLVLNYDYAVPSAWMPNTSSKVIQEVRALGLCVFPKFRFQEEKSKKRSILCSFEVL